jgi:hypothetical protein
MPNIWARGGTRSLFRSKKLSKLSPDQEDFLKKLFILCGEYGASAISGGVNATGRYCISIEISLEKLKQND